MHHQSLSFGRMLAHKGAPTCPARKSSITSSCGHPFFRSFTRCETSEPFLNRVLWTTVALNLLRRILYTNRTRATDIWHLKAESNVSTCDRSSGCPSVRAFDQERACCSARSNSSFMPKMGCGRFRCNTPQMKTIAQLFSMRIYDRRRK